MKILFCLGSLNRGGAERVVSNLANYFIKCNKVSIVITSPDLPQYELDKNARQMSLKNIVKINIFILLHRK